MSTTISWRSALTGWLATAVPLLAILATWTCTGGIPCLAAPGPIDGRPLDVRTFGARGDVVAETLSKTTLGYLKKGDQVNLEPPVTPAQPMGGHFVLGHVDGVGKVIDVQGESVCKWTICPPSDLLDDIVPRGSIAVEGVSMTVAEVGREVFQVALIPTTLELTTLGCYQVGRDVNLETDIISKTIVHLMHRRRLGNDGPVTKDLLREAGLIP